MKTPLLLVFDTAKTAQYVELMCRRKGTTPERYIVENMEWDDKPDCLMGWDDKPDCMCSNRRSHRICYDCQWVSVCPDKLNTR